MRYDSKKFRKFPRRKQHLFKDMESKRFSRKEFIFLAACGLFAAGVFGYNAYENFRCKKREKEPCKTPVEKIVSDLLDIYNVPGRYHDYYKELESLGVKDETRKMIAAQWFAESEHRHYYPNGEVKFSYKDGKIVGMGLTQLTNTGIKEVLRRKPIYRRNIETLTPHCRIAYRIGKNLLSKYKVKSFSEAKNLIMKDPEANLRFGTTLLLYYDVDARNLCQKYNLAYSREIPPAIYNAGPDMIEKALQRYGRQWAENVPSETKNVLLPRFRKHFNANITGI